MLGRLGVNVFAQHAELTLQWEICILNWLWGCSASQRSCQQAEVELRVAIVSYYLILPEGVIGRKYKVQNRKKSWRALLPMFFGEVGLANTPPNLSPSSTRPQHFLLSSLAPANVECILELLSLAHFLIDLKILTFSRQLVKGSFRKWTRQFSYLIILHSKTFFLPYKDLNIQQK